MLFINTTGELKILRKEGNIFYDVRPLDEVNLPEDVGLHYGFSKKKEALEKAKEPGEKPVVVDPDWKTWLSKIPKIKKKTVLDIVSIYPTRELAEHAVEKDEHMPFRDDIEVMLKKVLKK
jgi:hypothetical protein